MSRIKKDDLQRVANQTRQALSDAAAEEFAKRGYEKANINTISNKAGFAKGTIYNYFPTKQTLLLKLIDSIAQQHLEHFQSAIARIDDPQLRLERFFQAGFDFVIQNQDRARVMFNTVNSSSQEQKEYCFQAYQPIFRLLAEQILLPGMQLGFFRQAAPNDTALMLMSVYLGTASQVDEQGRPWLDSIQVAQFVLSGVRA